MARPKHQQGQIKLVGSSWKLAYYEDRVVDGKPKRVRTETFLAPYNTYPYRESETTRLRRELSEEIDKILRPVNKESANPNGAFGVNVRDFIEKFYFPDLEQRTHLEDALHIEPTTIKGYRDIFRQHVDTNPIADLRLSKVTAVDGQNFLKSVPQRLSHQTHLRVRAFMSGVFTFAIRSGAITGVNPMATTKAGGQSKGRKKHELTPRELKIRHAHEHAYTLEEVAVMLDKLPEPARTICAVAAFTGFTKSELRGLQWPDYHDGQIFISRKVVGSYEGRPKTSAREEGVFVVPIVAKILAKYKEEFPPKENGWIFRGERLGNPLSLDNMSRRDIPHFINGAWFGWHAFRRGLGTRLNDIGVDDKNIQSILRHGNISTTQAFYILPNEQRKVAGLKKLESMLKRKYNIKA